MIVKVQGITDIYKMEKPNVDNQDILLFCFCLFYFLTDIKYNVDGVVFVGIWTCTCVSFDGGGASTEK